MIYVINRESLNFGIMVMGGDSICADIKPHLLISKDEDRIKRAYKILIELENERIEEEIAQKKEQIDFNNQRTLEAPNKLRETS